MSVDLPGILAEVAEIAGERAAYLLADAKGGTAAYVPKPAALHDGHWLVEILGMDAAREIARRCDGNTVEIPLGPLAGCRNRVRATIRRALAEGKSLPEAARLAGVHQRTVRRQKNCKQKRTDQHRLL